MIYALTYHNKHNDIKSIDKMFNILSQYLAPNDKVYIIAVERNDINNNEHYHIMIDTTNENIENDLSSIGFWLKVIKESTQADKYFNYCKKDGKYKLYAKYDLGNPPLKWYEIALALYFEGKEIHEMIIQEPKLIPHIFKINEMFKELDKIKK